jgi:hypothetical protein
MASHFRPKLGLESSAGNRVGRPGLFSDSSSMISMNRFLCRHQTVSIDENLSRQHTETKVPVCSAGAPDIMEI